MLRFITAISFLLGVLSTQAQPGTTTESLVQLQEIFIEGAKEKLLGNFEKAAQKFEELLQKDPKNDAAAYELARVYDALKLTDKALSSAQNAASWNPQNIWYKIFLAELYQKASKYKEASLLYEQLLAQNPRNKEYFLKRAYFLVRAGETESAIKVYNDLEKVTGVQEETARLKHNLFVGLGNYKKAAKEYENLISAFPAVIGYRHLLATFFEQVNDKEKAREVYRQILQISPDDARAKISLSSGVKGNDDERFLNSLRTVFENPNIGIDIKIKEVLPYVNRLAEKGDANIGAVLLVLANSLEKVHPGEAKAHALLGDVLYYSGQTDRALSSYLRTLQLDNSVWTVWEQVLYIYADRKEFEKLAEYSEKALDYFPNQATAFYLNGKANNELDKPREALNSLQHGLIMTSGNPRLRHDIFVELGMANFLLKQYSKSDNAFEDALKINTKSGPALKAYSYCLAARGEQLGKAKELAMQLNIVAPGKFESEGALGFVFYKMKDFKSAQDWMSKALQHGGDSDPFILEQNGNILFQNGQTEQAVRYWQMALDKGGKRRTLERKIAEGKILE